MVYIVGYKQLKNQLQRVFGKDIRCIVMDYLLEESKDFTKVTFPFFDEITIVCGNDIRSRLLLLLAAKKYSTTIHIIELEGEYTHLAPLAISNIEFCKCCERGYLINSDKRSQLIKEYSNLPKSKYLKLYNGRINPLLEKEIEEFVLSQIVMPMDMKFAVGLCMGNAPYGWPCTDTFYARQIELLIKRDLLLYTGTTIHPKTKKAFN